MAPETLTPMGTNQRSQIVMSAAEITDFVQRSRTGTLATIGLGGNIIWWRCGTG